MIEEMIMRTGNTLSLGEESNQLTSEKLAKAKDVIERPLAKSAIKQRESGFGNKKLDYIEGHTVIKLLNEAFDYQWSFEISHSEIVQTKPTAGKYNKHEGDGHIAVVIGRLYVPGFGTKEQFGTKVVEGGPSVQEQALKSAATDALKKCATLFGVGLELYEDDKPVVKSTTTKPKQASDFANIKQEPKPATSALKEEFITQLKVLKSQLNIVDNEALNAYVSKATENKLTSYKDINNTNAKAIISLLEKEVTQQGH